jgi:hypothetical protein
MADLYEIIDLNTVFDDGVIKGAAIYSRASADFHIVAQISKAKLWDAYPTLAILREAESVATDNGTWMD